METEKKIEELSNAKDVPNTSGIRRKKIVRDDPNKVKFDFKNIDVKGPLNALVNKDIKITKKSGGEIIGSLRTITPNNQLLLALDNGANMTVYRDSIKKIQLLE